MLAASWWLCTRDRPLASGVALALATFIKPQLVAMIPLVLLASGRPRYVASWMIGCALLGAATIVTLGSSGLISWWHALQGVQADPAQTAETLAHLFGLGPLTYAMWSVQGAAALFIAYRRREPEIVFAAGILGSAAIAFHFHEWDYSNLILAAWLVLRTSPNLLHRLWLVVGVVPMQLMTYQASHAELFLVAPQLAWDALWLAILVAGSLGKTETSAREATKQVAQGVYGSADLVTRG